MYCSLLPYGMAINLKSLVAGYFLCASTIAFSQYEGLEKLMNSDLVVPEIVQYNPGQTTFFTIPDVQAPYMNGIAQHLVKNKKGLFLLPDGTGRVYKVERTGNSMTIVRQDSSEFFGYNFGCFPFTFNDTLYSFGGYGYWRFNGNLRVFIPQKGGWELENLNREIPFTRVGYTASPKWFDQQQGNFWIGVSIDSKEGIKQRSKSLKNVLDTVYMLNLQTKDWITIGILSTKTKELASATVNRNLGSSPWGQLIHDDVTNTVYLLDFNNNNLLTLAEEKAKTLMQVMEASSILYFKDSLLHIGLYNRPLDSLQLSKADFTVTDDPLYRQLNKTSIASLTKNTNSLWLALPIAVFMIGLGYLYYKKRKHQSNPQSLQQSIKFNAVKLFDDKEAEILKLLLTNSGKGLGTSIDALNKCLGVSQKNIEIQKKQRSETLIAINRKWRLKNSDQQLLIKKRRIEQDKRSFEYYIDFENLEQVNLLIKKL